MNAPPDWGQAIVLGVLQGLTEFLPVSSSGHLVLGQAALGLKGPALAFNILLHVGTLAAVLTFYGRDVWRIARAWALSPAGGADRVSARTGWLLILGTLPAALVGALFHDAIEEMFGSPRAAAYALFATGGLLFLSGGRAAGGRGESQMTWRDALLIGLFQAAALLPGLSRSGATIAAALFLGIEREQAARFSFLLAAPAIAGAFLLKAKELQAAPPAAWPPMLLGTAVAAAVGLLALGWLLRVLRSGNLRGFAYYCWAAGALATYLT